MAEGQVSDKQLIEALLRERDELYRRATKAERRLEELSDAEAMRQLYEARINEKDNEISQMKAEHQKQISNMEANRLHHIFEVFLRTRRKPRWVNLVRFPVAIESGIRHFGITSIIRGLSYGQGGVGAFYQCWFVNINCISGNSDWLRNRYSPCLPCNNK